MRQAMIKVQNVVIRHTSKSICPYNENTYKMHNLQSVGEQERAGLKKDK